MNYINRLPPQTSDFPDVSNGETRGFFGRIWDKVKSNIGTIVGAIFGGPIGGLIGNILQNWIDAGVDVNVSRIDIPELPEDGSADLTFVEEAKLDYFINNELKPTVISLASKIDQEVSFSVSQRGDLSNALLSINNILLNCAIAKSYAKYIFSKASSTGLDNSIIQNVDSKNYTSKKVALIDTYFNAVEKGVIVYVEQNHANAFKLINKDTVVSSVNKIESLNVSFDGNAFTAPVKKYVSKDHVIQANEEPAGDINTDLNTVSVENTSNESKVGSLILKLAIAIGVGYAVRKLAKKIKN